MGSPKAAKGRLGCLPSWRAGAAARKKKVPHLDTHLKRAAKDQLNEKKEKVVNGLIVWAGLIATAAFAAFIAIPGPPALGIKCTADTQLWYEPMPVVGPGQDGTTNSTVDWGDIEWGNCPAGLGSNHNGHVELAFKFYIYNTALSFFLSSAAILFQLISYMDGEAILHFMVQRLRHWRRTPRWLRDVLDRLLGDAYRVHLVRGVAFMAGMGSMVALAGLALCVAFLAAAYIQFGRYGSRFAKHWWAMASVGFVFYGAFSIIWLLILLYKFLAPEAWARDIVRRRATLSARKAAATAARASQEGAGGKIAAVHHSSASLPSSSPSEGAEDVEQGLEH